MAVLFSGSKARTDRHRVVITGAGVITALGLDWNSNVEGFRTGRAAFREVSLFDVTRQRVKHAAEVELPAELPRTNLSIRQQKRQDRAGRMLLLAAHQAWEQCGWRTSGTLPVVLGTTSGGMSLGETFYRQATGTPCNRRNQASRVVHYQPQRQGLDLMDAFGFQGPVFVIANACASGANAIGHAWSLLRNGRAERVLAGGFDAISQLVFAGFDSLQALSTTRCRPFDAARDGLALGEGAAMFALETLEHARGRKAAILGEIAGYGAATDAHHLTQPHPEGDAALAAMNEACRTAGVQASEIEYVNAHGTGTPLNDSSEASAINRWAGDAANSIAVSSTKSSIGHLLGAAGAVETAVCLMALQGQWLPPTTTIETADPAAKFRIVREPVYRSVQCVLTNSFGFGGANASLILRRWS